MGFTREDKESRKFLEDPSDSSKFLVRTTVENADAPFDSSPFTINALN